MLYAPLIAEKQKIKRFANFRSMQTSEAKTIPSTGAGEENIENSLKTETEITLT